jgi:hypothetical protein
MTSRHYERPQIFVLGGFRELTLESKVPNDGEDPCRFNNPRGVFKQTGAADYVQGNANLSNCSSLVITS